MTSDMSQWNMDHYCPKSAEIIITHKESRKLLWSFATIAENATGYSWEARISMVFPLTWLPFLVAKVVAELLGTLRSRSVLCRVREPSQGAVPASHSGFMVSPLKPRRWTVTFVALHSSRALWTSGCWKRKDPVGFSTTKKTPCRGRTKTQREPNLPWYLARSTPIACKIQTLHQKPKPITYLAGPKTTNNTLQNQNPTLRDLLTLNPTLRDLLTLNPTLPDPLTLNPTLRDQPPTF